MFSPFKILAVAAIWILKGSTLSKIYYFCLGLGDFFFAFFNF